MNNNIMRITLLVSILAFSGITAIAQKIATVDAQVILTYMPETKAAQAELEKINAQKQADLEKIKALYESLQKDLNDGYDTLEYDERQDLNIQIENTYKRYQFKMQNIQQALALEEQKLMQPIYDKLKAAIKEIATTNGYTYVLSAASVFYSADETMDITELVAAKLGAVIPTDPAANGTPGE